MNSTNYGVPRHAIFSSLMFPFISLSRDKLFKTPTSQASLQRETLFHTHKNNSWNYRCLHFNL